MRIHFVGADLEENLGLGILAAVVEREGHRPRIVPFNDVSEIDDAVKRAMSRDPDVIGLSIQFQHRAPEFLALARKLREAGYAGHITCGGQFPTLAWKETLEGSNGVDSVLAAAASCDEGSTFDGQKDDGYDGSAGEGNFAPPYGVPGGFGGAGAGGAIGGAGGVTGGGGGAAGAGGGTGGGGGAGGAGGTGGVGGE